MVVEDGAPTSDRLTARARAFCLASDVDILGIFRIPAGAFDGGAVHPDVDPALRLFLPRLSNGDALSRGERYYDVRSALLAWPALLAACRRLAGVEEEGDARVTLALYENLFNVAAAMTFSYWERCCDEPEQVDERRPVLAFLVAILPELARLHLGAALGTDLAGARPAVDWDLLHSVGSRFPRGWRLRTLREFDNKSRVLNEVLYLGRELRALWPFQAVLFPLYGALTLAAYFSAVESLLGGLNGRRLLPVLIRLGVYDRGSTTYRTPDGSLDLDRLLPRPWLEDARRALHGSRVLVVDDNAATGHTLRACREFVLQCGGVPLTRSAETSWELLGLQPSERACFEGVDLPGLRTNMSHAFHRSLVDLLLRRQWDTYAERAERLGRTDFSAGLRKNYGTARKGDALLPRQRWSVEHEWAHASRHWSEPGYPSLPPPSDPGSLRLPCEGFPDGVRPWALGAPARSSGAGLAPSPGGPSVVGAHSFVLAAGSTNRVRVAVPGSGRLRLSLGGWSAVLPVSIDPVDVEVTAPGSAGGHQLVVQFWSPGVPVAERRYPVHVVAPGLVDVSVLLAGDDASAAAIHRTGAVVEATGPAGGPVPNRPVERGGTPLVVGEGALDPTTAPLLRATLASGGTALVLAQEHHASSEFPIPVCLERMRFREYSPNRFTTGHHALASLPRHRVLSFEDEAMLPTSVFTRLGSGPWAAEVAVGVLAADGSVRGTVIGALDVLRGRLIVCQLALVEPVAAGHPGAGALLADLLRWAGAPRRTFGREDVVLSDGRSMSFYPFPGGRP